MKLATELKSQTDVCQHINDQAFAYKTIVLAAALTAPLQAGDCITDAGALVKSTDTTANVVADFVPTGSKTIVVFDKMVVLKKASFTAFDAAGVTKAIELLSANQFIKLI